MDAMADDTAAALAAFGARLDRAERAARRWRAGCVALAAAVVAGAAVGAGERAAVPDVVRAHRLELVDAAGNVRVAGDATTRPAVTVYDAGGRQAVLLAGDTDRAIVLVGGAGRADAASLDSTDGSGGGLYMGGHGSSVLVSTATNAVHIDAVDGDGRVVWRAAGGPPPTP